MREAAPQPGLAPGDRVGGYRIVRLLGAGGMGEVYLGQHRHLERQAAIKVLLPQVSSHPEVLRRFFAEARTTSKLAHPNIVEILDCDVLEDGRAFIVMEFLEGESLAGYLEKTASSPTSTQRRL